MATVESALVRADTRDQQHPVVAQTIARRSEDMQLRVADAITRFAGSMWFVYIHIVAFAVWMLWIEQNPWPTLTLAVSLEAIFLSTFVMIGQNRQSDFQQRKADYEFNEQESELKRIAHLAEKVHTLLVEVDRRVPSRRAADEPGAG